ncbi:hypothetical protein ABFS82_03G078700 [Erythranthe guttata]|uniref:uncharacterized protein LOC105950664 n=1 Tax=Erythranthe guttata TaxID=4155 RepID=UPI00064E05CD|nr:PREDICTED: uncharacterized protein LOC105950664 [Erythranthe guttata]|eukprot:XP_012829485.1 PREDICTED: uncharacterized protein LOC105950664 [Erythranthe guttata]
MSLPEFDFDSLTELHNSVNELLSSPTTKREIIHNGHEKWGHDVSEASLKMADSCSAAKDLLLLAKDHLQSLQSAFRRIAATTETAENNFAHHRLPRKQLKKAILKRIHSLKAGSQPPQPAAAAGQTLAAVVNLLKEVRATTLLIVRSVLTLIAIPNPVNKPGSGKKDPIFRIRFTRVDSLSIWEKSDVVLDTRSVMKRLEEVEMVVGDMEAELEDMFRRLIRTRASLLNILNT